MKEREYTEGPKAQENFERLATAVLRSPVSKPKRKKQQDKPTASPKEPKSSDKD